MRGAPHYAHAHGEGGREKDGKRMAHPRERARKRKVYGYTHTKVESPWLTVLCERGGYARNARRMQRSFDFYSPPMDVHNRNEMDAREVIADRSWYAR